MALLDLMLDLLTGGAEPDADLSPTFHEAGKLRPEQVGRRAALSREQLREHMEEDVWTMLARAARGIPLADRSRPVASDSRPRAASAAMFSGQSVSAAVLGAVLYSALHEHEAHILDPYLPGDHEPRTYVLAWRIEGIAGGSYFYWSRGHRLIPIRTPTEARENHLFLDGARVLGAAALVVMCAIAHERYPDGLAERCYRELLLRSGHMARELLVEAATQGLAAGIASGFLDDVITAELGLDPLFDRPVHVVALGARR